MKRQRTARTSQTQALATDGDLISIPEDVTHGFAGHFDRLATPGPSRSDKYDSQYMELMSTRRRYLFHTGPVKY